MKFDLTGAIGGTPLVPLEAISRGCAARIAAKLEGFNPGGSVKDRPALYMVDRAEREGLLRPGGMIVEPTSGNTGIGLAVVASVKGYSLTVTMPDSMSVERRKVLASYGARVVLTPAGMGMAGAVAEAERIVSTEANCFMPMQFGNPANPEAHMRTTDPEIWEQTRGKVDGFICGVGTGGTVTGVGEMLKSMRSGIGVFAVEPAESPVLSGGRPGPHSIEGIGAGFVPDVLNLDVVDEVLTVTSEEAGTTARRLARMEGIFAGISSGAALAAAIKLAGRGENKGKLLVVLFPDRGENYLSTGLWD